MRSKRKVDTSLFVCLGVANIFVLLFPHTKNLIICVHSDHISDTLSTLKYDATNKYQAQTIRIRFLEPKIIWFYEINKQYFVFLLVSFWYFFINFFLKYQNTVPSITSFIVWYRLEIHFSKRNMQLLFSCFKMVKNFKSSFRRKNFQWKNHANQQIYMIISMQHFSIAHYIRTNCSRQ